MRAVLRWSWMVGPEDQSLGHTIGIDLLGRLKGLLEKIYRRGLEEALDDGRPFAVTARVWVEGTEVNLHSELLIEPADEAGSVGGEVVLTIPDDENGHKLADFLAQEEFFSDLDLTSDSGVKGWGPRLTGFGAEVNKLPDNFSLQQRLVSSGWDVEKMLPEFLKAKRPPWWIAIDRRQKIVVKALLTEDLREQLIRKGLFPLVRELIQIVQ